MASTVNVIEFPGIVYAVKTLVDNGLRITLDLPEQCIPQAAMLMECKKQGIALKFAASADKSILTKLDDDKKKKVSEKSEKSITYLDR